MQIRFHENKVGQSVNLTTRLHLERRLSKNVYSFSYMMLRLRDTCTFYLVQGTPFKTQLNNNQELRYQKLNQKVHPRVIHSPKLPRGARIKIILAARPLLTPVAQKLCKSEQDVFTTEHGFILEHYFASKSFAAVREAFSNAYPDKEVPNKTTIQRLVTKSNKISGHNKCLFVTSAHRATKQLNNGRTHFKQCLSCNNGIRLDELKYCHWCRFVREGVHV
jgi:hypothetical protein